MFENKRIAKAVLDLLLEYGAKLEKSAQLVRENCGSLDEYLTYKNEVDHLMDRMLEGVITPILKCYPDLKPPDRKAQVTER
jgi:hypothetical protein